MKRNIIDRILSFTGADVTVYEYESFYTAAYKNGESEVFDKNGFPKLKNFSEMSPDRCKNPKLVYK